MAIWNEPAEKATSAYLEVVVLGQLEIVIHLQIEGLLHRFERPYRVSLGQQPLRVQQMAVHHHFRWKLGRRDSSAEKDGNNDIGGESRHAGPSCGSARAGVVELMIIVMKSFRFSRIV